MKKIYRILSFAVILGSLFFTSCSLDTDVIDNIDYTKNPITNESELDAAVIGAYALMTGNEYYGNNAITFSDVRSENVWSDGRSNRLNNVSAFGLTSTSKYTVDTWKQIYLVVSEANRVIEANVKETDVVRNLKGQAFVIRALAHYDLLRLYGEQYVDNSGLTAIGVPYIKNYANINAKVVRGTVKENRDDIFADLEKGITLLEKGGSKSNKIKISQTSAYGIKARIALFFSDWVKSDLVVARDAADKAMLLSGGQISNRAGFVDSYNADDPQGNSIFELKQSGVDNPGTESIFYVYADDERGYGDLLLNFAIGDLFGADAPAENVEANDIRASKRMIDEIAEEWRNVGKYTKLSSNLKIMRYEELVLIYIEADYRLNNIGSGRALELYNDLKSNRLEKYNAVQGYTLDDVRIERQKELLFEGFGFEDLMRFHLPIVNEYGTIDFGAKKLAFPIPQTEINASGIKQNQGY